MVDSIYFQKKAFRFSNHTSLQHDENIFTVIVGRNGTGKSTLLSTVVSELLNEYSGSFYNDLDLGFKPSSHGRLVVYPEPKTVIAVSSSPFDKFPLTKKFNGIEKYFYLGLRDISSSNFGLSYMSKIISSLIESLYNNPSHWISLAKVLHYLNYLPVISAKFSLSINKEFIREFISVDTNYDSFFFQAKQLNKNINRRFFLNELEELDSAKINKLKDILFSLISFEGNFRLTHLINVQIDGLGVHIPSNEIPLDSDQIAFLINSGILRLKDLNLVKNNTHSTYSIKDASSGEQSVILSVLGIASRITHNSIICIDEPEVCLHPEWQEKYIQILSSTFDIFRSCHFIIATHSPQIISNLNHENSFVVSMEDAKITNASELTNNSADFTLVNVFKYAGHKNEYLHRLAFNLFSKFTKSKHFDSEDLKKLMVLEKSLEIIQDTDPVKDLIIVLLELLKRNA